MVRERAETRLEDLLQMGDVWFEQVKVIGIACALEGCVTGTVCALEGCVTGTACALEGCVLRDSAWTPCSLQLKVCQPKQEEENISFSLFLSFKLDIITHRNDTKLEI